jgi:hypothetical protein
MPTAMKLGPYRFHFYSDEEREPVHIHVETPDSECKFWLGYSGDIIPILLCRHLSGIFSMSVGNDPQVKKVTRRIKVNG